MLILKFLITKNGQINELKGSYDQIISENFNLLYLNSKYFNDNFTKDFIEKSGILNRKFIDKSEIMKEFNLTKKQALFSIFFKSHVKSFLTLEHSQLSISYFQL